MTDREVIKYFAGEGGREGRKGGEKKKESPIDFIHGSYEPTRHRPREPSTVK